MEEQEKNKKNPEFTKPCHNLPLGWRIVLVLFIAIGIFASIYFAIGLIKKTYDKMTEEKYYVSEDMGNGYELRTYYDGPDRIAKEGKRRAVVKNVYSAEGNDEDSLWLIYNGDRYSYFNTQTGRLLPASYRMAWCYSEGIAAVMDDDLLIRFIDPQGKPVFETTFPLYHKDEDSEYKYYDHYFHNGLCLMYNTEGKWGLIDLSGNWVIEPNFDNAEFHSDFWALMRNDSIMVVNSKGETTIGLTPGQELHVTEDGDLEVWHQLHPGQLYNTEGKLLANQTYYQIETISYYEDEEEISTGMLAYYTEYERCGLMSPDGHKLTDAIYSEIKALDMNLFRAMYTLSYDEYDYSIYVLLNEKGELVEEKGKQ